MADSCLAFRPQFTVLLEQCVNNSTIIHTKLNRLQGVNESRSTATHSRITELALYIVLPLLLFEIFGGCEFVCRLLSQVHVQKAKTLVFTKWMQWRAPSPKAYLANEIYQQHKTVVYAHSESCGPNEEEGPRSMHNDQQKGSSKLGSEAKEEMLRKQGRDLSGHIHGGQLPPDSLCCPILLQVFVNPVRTKYGHVFERVALEHWLDLRTECPLTRQPLSKVDICKAHDIARMVKRWRRHRGFDFSKALSTHGALQSKIEVPIETPARTPNPQQSIIRQTSHVNLGTGNKAAAPAPQRGNARRLSKKRRKSKCRGRSQKN